MSHINPFEIYQLLAITKHVAEEHRIALFNKLLDIPDLDQKMIEELTRERDGEKVKAYIRQHFPVPVAPIKVGKKALPKKNKDAACSGPPSPLDP